MKTLIGAVRKALQVPDVTSKITTYDMGSGLEPALFTIDPIPEDCALSAVVITQIASSPFGTRDARGSEVRINVRAWGDKTRSRIELMELGEAIWKALHRTALWIDGYDEIGCYAEYPTQLTDADGFPGVIVNVMVRILEG